MRLLVILMLCGITFVEVAHLCGQSMGRRSGNMALGYIITVADSDYSIAGNIAGLAQIDKNHWESFINLPFGLVELASYEMGWAFQGKIPLSVGVHHLSTPGYKHERIAGGFGSHWGLLDLGVQIHLHRISLQSVQYIGINTELGLWITLSSKLKIGLNLMNASRQKVGDATLPGHVFIGVELNALKFLRLLLEVGQEYHRPINFRWGIEGTLYEKIAFSTGYDFLFDTLTAGIGWSLKKWDLAYAIAIHHHLGLSHQWKLHFTW